MATITKGYTFGATESVTNAKLHSLVESATITNIVNADIDSGALIAFSKLAQENIDASKLIGMENITDDGIIPMANLPKDADDTLAANSDAKIPTQKAVKTYTDAKVNDTAFAASWDNVTTIAPSKNSVYDKINSIPLIDTQIFSTAGAGTWTKLGGGATYALIKMWGAGGSGGVGGAGGGGCGGGGGGGGAYVERLILLSTLGTTEAISVGAGGAAKVGAGNGNVGGNTTFGTAGTLITIYGGGAGGGNAADASGGGGGGYTSVGANAAGAAAGAGGSPTWFFTGAAGVDSVGVDGFIGGGGGGDGAGGTGYAGGNSFWGGGGGAGGNATGNGGVGGNSVYGGAGGGGGSGDSTGGAGGISINGGAGGAGSTAAANATAGSQPAGGGGGSEVGNSGAGGDGKVIIISF